ncbi:MAG: class I SAM-dependent methyltransferase [Anaerolineae bacterium]|nr:class I SAM-dependent methyltransferase [Anaerolineae bacterium]
MTSIDQKANRHTRSRYDFMAPFYNAMEFVVEKLRFQHWRKALWRKVPVGHVLEVGVGTGKNMPYYSSGMQVTAIDLSEKMIAQAEKTAKKSVNVQLEIRAMDAQQLEFGDNNFDSVLATFVFCSVPDPVLGLQEARRVTKSGGQLFLLEHMVSGWPWLARLMIKIDGLVHWIMGLHIARPTVAHVEEAGWVVDQVTPLGPTGIFRMIEAHKNA